MTKKTAADQAAEVSWIKDLPGGGGDWGKGVTGVVNAAAAELDSLEGQIAQLQTTATHRRKLLNETVKRAEKEGPLMFTDRQIAAAKNPVTKANAPSS